MDETPEKGWKRRARKAREAVRRGVEWVRRNVPPGLRTVLGLLLVGAGILGFLPILGFWMIPLGVAIILLDALALYRLVRTVLLGKR